MMKIAVIGSGGFVGGNLMRHFSEKGVEAIGFSSSRAGCIDPATGLLSDGFDMPEGVGAVVYLAQSPHYGRGREMAAHLLAVNAVSAVKAAGMAQKAGVKRFLYASTGNVYAPSLGALSEGAPVRRDNWYSLSKVHAEEALSLYRGNGMDIVIARPFGIYGPGQTDKLVARLTDSVMRGCPVSLDANPLDKNDVDGLRVSLCYIADAVDMLSALALDGGPPVINIAGEEPVSMRRLAGLIGACLEKPVAFNMSGKGRDSNLIADLTLLKKALNPAFTRLEDGIKKTVDYELLKKA